MVTVRDYAEKRGVSVQAIYKQMKAHEKELKGHVKIVKKIKYLDDYAVEYLTVQSSESPTIIMQTDQNERIEQLERENHNLLLKVAELQEQVIKKSERIEQLQEEKTKFLIENVKISAENKVSFKSLLGKLMGLQKKEN